MSIHLSTTSIIVPAIDGASFGAIAETRDSEAAWDCVELRLDLFQPPPAPLPWPVLLTPRHPDEGGAPSSANPAARTQLCEPWLPFAAGIDVEIAHAAEVGELLSGARANGVTVVLSFHDFDATPGSEALEATVRRGIEAGADIVKVATHTETPADVDRLLALFDAFPNQALAVMGMGPEGKASRLEAAKRGSVLNYACVGEPTVPGQWRADAFKLALEEAGVR